MSSTDADAAGGERAARGRSTSLAGRGAIGGDPGVATATATLLALAVLCSLLVPHVVGGVPAKSLACVACATLALVLRIRCSDAAANSTTTTLGSAGFATMLLAAIAAAPGAKVPMAAFAALPLYVAMLAAHVAATALRTTSLVRAVSSAAVAGGALVACVGLVCHREFEAALAAGRASGAARSMMLATPFFEHAYVAVQAVAPLVPLAIALALGARTVASRAAFALSSLAIAAFAAATLSRAAAVAVVAGVVAVFAASRARPDHRETDRRARAGSRLGLARGAMVVMLAVVAPLLVVPDEFLPRYRSLLDPAFAPFNFMRVLVWEDTLRIIADHLPLGVGPGNFGFVLGDYHVAARPVSHAHDQILQTLAEIGVLGLCGLLLAAAAPLLSASASEAGSDVRRLRAGLAGALVTLGVLAIFESPLAFAGAAIPFACFSGAFIALSSPNRIESTVTGSLDSDSASLAARARLPRVCLIVALAGLAIAAPSTLRYARAGSKADAANAALAKGDVEGARTLAAAAESIAPRIPEVLAIRAIAERKGGDLAAAHDALVRHERVVPGLPELLIERASLEIALSRPDLAIESLRKAKRRATGELAEIAGFELANALYHAERYEEARLQLVELVAANVHQKRPVVLLRLAETLINLGRDRKTIVSLLDGFEARIEGSERRYIHELRASLPALFPR